MGTDEPSATAAETDPVAELQAKVDGLTQQLARTRAELANTLRDRAREIEDAGARAQVPILKVLGEVHDDLERAMEAAAADPSIQAGLELVHRRIEQAFELHRVTVERPLGKPFDPRRHEAVMREATDAHPDGTVIEVFQPGLMAGERVVRPALVKVATKRDEGKGKKEAEEE